MLEKLHYHTVGQTESGQTRKGELFFSAFNILKRNSVHKIMKQTKTQLLVFILKKYCIQFNFFIVFEF